MSLYQPGILAKPVPSQARYMFFALKSVEALPAALDTLSQWVDGKSAVAGLGSPLVLALGAKVQGLRVFPALNAVVENPSTQHALWLWLLGDDRGELLHRSQAIEVALAPAFNLLQVTEGFRYRTDHDLTGYEDGTENPVDEAAVEAAVVASAGPGQDGGVFVAVQQWQHDLNGFAARPQSEQDNTIGRRKSDNEELDDAPESAHVKRTAQESFSPEAFTVRRSLPWTENGKSGLMFVSFSRTLNAFEVQLRRMSGMEDGIVDALYSFSRPLNGGYYWCPPLKDGRLDLSALRPA